MKRWNSSILENVSTSLCIGSISASFDPSRQHSVQHSIYLSFSDFNGQITNQVLLQCGFAAVRLKKLEECIGSINARVCIRYPKIAKSVLVRLFSRLEYKPWSAVIDRLTKFFVQIVLPSRVFPKDNLVIFAEGKLRIGRTQKFVKEFAVHPDDFIVFLVNVHDRGDASHARAAIISSSSSPSKVEATEKQQSSFHFWWWSFRVDYQR